MSLSATSSPSVRFGTAYRVIAKSQDPKSDVSRGITDRLLEGFSKAGIAATEMALPKNSARREEDGTRVRFILTGQEMQDYLEKSFNGRCAHLGEKADFAASFKEKAFIVMKVLPRVPIALLHKVTGQQQAAIQRDEERLKDALDKAIDLRVGVMPLEDGTWLTHFDYSLLPEEPQQAVNLGFPMSIKPK